MHQAQKAEPVLTCGPAHNEPSGNSNQGPLVATGDSGKPVASISLYLMTLARTIAGDRPRQSLSCNLLLTTLVVHV